MFIFRDIQGFLNGKYLNELKEIVIDILTRAISKKSHP
jgi:hypothetical protein